MNEKNSIDRRSACAAIVGMGGMLATGQATAAEKNEPATGRRTRKRKEPLRFNNADFYGADGKFNEEAAKKAYLDLCRYFGYPINETLVKDIFVSDLGLGKFTEAGLAAVAWMNEKEANYCSLEVLLLPNQMIPEHWHVAVESEGVKPKMESWVVRYGSTFTYGEGEPTEQIAVKIPEIESKHVTVRCEKELRPGESTGVKKPMEKHWQQAGPEGVILTEVSTYHTPAAVRWTDPRIKF
jgi:hypothetical protein